MNPRRTGLLVLVLLAVLLAAQTHSFADATLPHARAHSCPVCAFGIWAIPATLPAPGSLLETHRLENLRVATTFVFNAPRCLSPRAPPAL